VRSSAAALCLLAVLGASPAWGAPGTTTATAAMDPSEAAEQRRLEAVAKAYEQAEPEPNAQGGAVRAERPLPSFGAQILQMVLMLGAVVAFAYLVLGKLLPRVMGMSATGRRAMMAAPSRGVVEVIDRLPLDPRRSLMVVRVGEECFLVGLSGEGMTLLSRLDDSKMELPAERGEAPATLSARFQRLLEGQREKEKERG
jgi:flagellar protein FliO/FliZ